jgi:Cu/Ag efflux protein CusF
MYSLTKHWAALAFLVCSVSFSANAAQMNKQEEVVTTGVVKSVMTETNQLKIKHQMIPEWDMKAMQMKFNLAPNLNVKDFKQGQTIRFRMKHKDMMKFTVLEVLK